MRIALTTFDRSFDPVALVGSTAIVIDVLRATTVIACALANGAREIIPVEDPDEARALAAQTTPRALLGGEFENLRIEGFDFGNSPREYLPERVRDARIILRTTNGTRALVASKGASYVWCAALANVGAVIHKLSTEPVDRVTLVCAGQNGTFSLEDFVCAGAIVAGVSARKSTSPDDAAIAAAVLFTAHENSLESLLRRGNHAQALVQSGMEDDIPFAAQVDRCDLVPVYEDGRIVACAS